MIYLTDESELKVSEGISGIYFYADWLVFHKKMKIMIDKVTQHNENIKFFAVDVDSFPKLCTRFAVESIPTVVIMKKGGEEVGRINGMSLTSAFKKTFIDIYALHGEENAKSQ